MAVTLSPMGPAEVAHGWIFIGFTINVLLLGVMTTQVYLYYAQYKNDKAWIKAFVAALFFADILNTGFGAAYVYRCLITNFANPEALAEADWLFACDPAMTAIIALAVQLFFAWRVYVLTKTWIYSLIITAVGIAGGICGVITAVMVVRIPQFTEFQRFKNVVVIWLAGEAIGDVIITSILVWYLRKHKTGFARSDMMVDRIIRITVQTGLLTMIVATLDMGFYLGDPSGIHLMFNFPLAKLYSNSLMSSLNSRRGWKYNTGSTTAGGESEGQIVTTGNFKSRNNVQVASRPVPDVVNLSEKKAEVFVHVESHELRDVQRNEKTDGWDNSGRQQQWAAV